ncbi:gamma-glutamyl-gamma-aminobutyrate hydrolase family protein [Amnibacterium flavum]|uniref:Uncharacterized protein n=1 Tax=Amnibacterium flavum TaxID=2173173 RepID=A0A2V1HPL4_9MICO|nr:gamma-glutamyl-gamma-aminobutyrate hydrolase family protein [Amnibacterium flavum]PVZ94536.1 hypothetical protein DDQ50_12615 [Amnibacterium flavum]
MRTRRVAVLHVTGEREHNPTYQRLADDLNVSAVATIASLGWQSRLHAAADSSVGSALAIARDSHLIVVVGGEDVRPDFYGGPLDYTGAGSHSAAADEAQLAVIRDAALRGTPVLGICRGHQIINVALGGDLIQHLEETGQHRVPTPGAATRFTRHTVDLADSSLQHAIAAGEYVQSSHHQAVGRLGDGLRAVAASSDGVVEAITHASLPIVGVQWHPEHTGAPADQLARLLRHTLTKAA